MVEFGLGGLLDAIILDNGQAYFYQNFRSTERLRSSLPHVYGCIHHSRILKICDGIPLQDFFLKGRAMSDSFPSPNASQLIGAERVKETSYN